MEPEVEEIKMYSDFKSPFAYLAFEPAFGLERRFRVRVRWIPFQLRIKGKGERSEYSEYKVQYSYLDARRWAKLRGGMVIRGPSKIYDTTPALIGGLFAAKHGQLLQYGCRVYDLFFRRELELDMPAAVAGVIADLGLSERDYRAFLDTDGRRDYELAQQEAAADHVFGVPMFFFRNEPFWGYDRMGLLEMRLKEAGLVQGFPG